jgi:hypothetical protein
MSNYQGEQRVNTPSNLGMMLPGLSMAEMVNPGQTILVLKAKIAELEAQLAGKR